MRDWKDEFDQLPEEQQAAVRNCALRFRVPLLHAYLRAKDFGLLDAKERKE